MRKFWAIVLVTGALGVPSFAQGEKNADTKNAAIASEHFYRLDFSLQEVEGERIINSREYSMILSNTNSSSMRAGAHIPAGPQLVNLGVYIDCKDARELGNQFQLSIRAEINSMVKSDEKGTESPITRDNSWQSEVMLPLRHPTLLFSSDDPATKRKMQLILAVTPLR